MEAWMPIVKMVLFFIAAFYIIGIICSSDRKNFTSKFVKKTVFVLFLCSSICGIFFSSLLSILYCNVQTSTIILILNFFASIVIFSIIDKDKDEGLFEKIKNTFYFLYKKTQEAIGNFLMVAIGIVIASIGIFLAYMFFSWIGATGVIILLLLCILAKKS